MRAHLLFWGGLLLLGLGIEAHRRLHGTPAMLRTRDAVVQDYRDVRFVGAALWSCPGTTIYGTGVRLRDHATGSPLAGQVCCQLHYCVLTLNKKGVHHDAGPYFSRTRALVADR